MILFSTRAMRPSGSKCTSSLVDSATLAFIHPVPSETSKPSDSRENGGRFSAFQFSAPFRSACVIPAMPRN